MTFRFGLCVALTAFVLVGIGVQAGPDNVVFPQGFEKGVRYAVVDRADNKQVREVYASPEVIAAVRQGKPIPSGAVITMVTFRAKADAQGVPTKDGSGRFEKGDPLGFFVMEKRTGWGAEYPPDIRNGDWEYQAFTADRKINVKAQIKNCFECHKPKADQDFVFSLPMMKSAQ